MYSVSTKKKGELWLLCLCFESLWVIITAFCVYYGFTDAESASFQQAVPPNPELLSAGSWREGRAGYLTWAWPPCLRSTPTHQFCLFFFLHSFFAFASKSSANVVWQTLGAGFSIAQEELYEWVSPSSAACSWVWHLLSRRCRDEKTSLSALRPFATVKVFCNIYVWNNI